MEPIEIVGAELSPFVSKVAAAADYKKIPYTLKDIASIADLKRANPVTGKMPVMRIDGELVYDSTFILRRLDALRPEPSLLSPDARVAAQQRLLEDWADESFYWHVMALRWCDENAKRTVAQMSSILPAPIRPVAGPLLRRMIGGTAKAQGLGRLPYGVLIQEIGERLDDLALQLGAGRFLFGDAPCVADFAVYGQFNIGRSEATPDFSEALSERPALVDWHKRVEEARRH